MKKSRATQVPAQTPDAVPAGKYVLRLYVAGATARSRQAILRARELCESELGGLYALEVVDIYQQPILARDGQILATPTLVREFPKPVLRFIGSLSNLAGVFAGLELDTSGRTKP